MVNGDKWPGAHPGAPSGTPRPDATVLLCDEGSEVRQALHAAISEQPGFTVVGQAIDGLGCLALISLAMPDILILDLRVPGARPELVTAAKRVHPSLHILVCSVLPDPAMQRAMFDAGADQYLVKTGRLEPLLTALERAARKRWETGC